MGSIVRRDAKIVVTAIPCPSFPGFFATEDGRIFTDWYKPGNRIGPNRRRNWVRRSRLLLEELIPRVDGRGYFRVDHAKFPNSEKRSGYKMVYHLVLDAFHGPKPVAMQGRHLDGNKSNNHKSNLKWGTSLENNRDKVIHGTSCKGIKRPTVQGEKAHNAILSDGVVLKIKLLRKVYGWGGCRIGALLNLKPSTVGEVISGRNWSHVQL